MGRFLAILLLFVSLSSDSVAQTTKELWQAASTHYADENFVEAITTYKAIEDEIVSSELYFNLGNCYYQVDSAAEAILYFEKALKLNPRDAYSRDNLELAMNLRDDPIPAIDEFFLMKWSRVLSQLLPPIGWGILTLTLLWLTVWMIVKSIKRDTLRHDRTKYSWMIVAFLFSLVLGAVAYQHQTESDYAIVMDGLEIRIAPDELSAVTRTITEGEKVKIIEELEGYYKVRFVNYEHGWVPVSAVRHI